MIRFSRMSIALGSLLVGISGVAGHPAIAQTHIKDAPDPWVHRGTGTRFPARLGDFLRADVTEYNPDGTDASAAYNLVRDGKALATVTVFVYPVLPTLDCAATFADIEASIRQGHTGVAKR